MIEEALRHVVDKVSGKRTIAQKKLLAAREEMTRAQHLFELASSSAWQHVRAYLAAEIERLQQLQNNLSTDPYGNAAEIIALNASRDAHRKLLLQIEGSGDELPHWREQVAKYERYIATYDAYGSTGFTDPQWR